jgi:hypothetical protein
MKPRSVLIDRLEYVERAFNDRYASGVTALTTMRSTNP